MADELRFDDDIVLEGEIIDSEFYYGLSAYQVALKNGFVGSESEWLESLNGDDYVITQADYQAIADIVEEQAQIPRKVSQLENDEEFMSRYIMRLVKNADNTFKLTDLDNVQLSFDAIYNAIKDVTNYAVIVYGNSKLRPQYISTSEMMFIGIDRSTETKVLRLLVTPTNVRYETFKLTEYSDYESKLDNVDSNIGTLNDHVSELNAEIDSLKSELKKQELINKSQQAAIDGKLSFEQLDESEAYAKAVPNKALPMASIESVSGKCKKVDGEIQTYPLNEVVSKGANLLGTEYGELYPCELKVGDKITMCCKDTRTVPINLRMYNKDKTYVDYWDLQPTMNVRTIAVVKDCAYITMWPQDKVDGATLYVEMGEVTNPSYLPYHSPTHYPIPQEIRDLRGYGWSAGDAHNYIDFEHKQYVQCVERGTINDLRYYVSGNKNVGGLGYTNTGTKVCVPHGQIICNMVKADNNQDHGWGSETPIICTQLDGVIRLYDTQEHLDNKSTYYANLEFYYEIEPKFTPLPDLDDFMIETEANGSIEFVTDGTKEPIKSSVKYGIKVD